LPILQLSWTQRYRSCCADTPRPRRRSLDRLPVGPDPYVVHWIGFQSMSILGSASNRSHISGPAYRTDPRLVGPPIDPRSTSIPGRIIIDSHGKVRSASSRSQIEVWITLQSQSIPDRRSIPIGLRRWARSTSVRYLALLSVDPRSTSSRSESGGRLGGLGSEGD
jgi:hypothetical protein